MNTFEIKKGYFKVYDGKTAYDLYVDENRNFDNLFEPEYIYQKGIDTGLSESEIIDLMLQFLHRRRIIKGDLLSDLNLCIALIGPRGSGKSVGLTGISVLDGLLAGRTVVSNMPIQLKVKYRDIEKVFETEDLDAISMLDVNDFDENYYGCMICVDEVNVYIADSQRTTSNQALFFSYILQQMRHRKLDFIFTTQNESWQTDRMRFQIDFYISCRDAALVNGIVAKNKIGRRSNWKLYDMSGLVTGEVLRSDGRTWAVPHFNEMTFWNVPFWGCYSTELMQRRNKYDLKQTKTFTTDIDLNRLENLENTYDIPFKMVSKIIQLGKERIAKSEIWKILGVEGNRGMQSRIGKVLNDIGCKTINKRDYLMPTQKDMIKNLNNLGFTVDTEGI